MASIIITYTLKQGVTPQDFAQWVKTVDQPTMRGLARVKSFETYRIDGMLIGDGPPSFSYVEVFDVPDLAGFGAQDMPGETVQSIMAQFLGFAEAPQFLVATAL